MRDFFLDLCALGEPNKKALFRPATWTHRTCTVRPDAAWKGLVVTTFTHLGPKPQAHKFGPRVAAGELERTRRPLGLMCPFCWSPDCGSAAVRCFFTLQAETAQNVLALILLVFFFFG